LVIYLFLENININIIFILYYNNIKNFMNLNKLKIEDIIYDTILKNKNIGHFYTNNYIYII
jgi:hypothetical protein